jgi:hypothetical protein
MVALTALTFSNKRPFTLLRFAAQAFSGARQRLQAFCCDRLVACLAYSILTAIEARQRFPDLT